MLPLAVCLAYFSFLFCLFDSLIGLISSSRRQLLSDPPTVGCAHTTKLQTYHTVWTFESMRSKSELKGDRIIDANVTSRCFHTYRFFQLSLLLCNDGIFWNEDSSLSLKKYSLQRLNVTRPACLNNSILYKYYLY